MTPEEKNNFYQAGYKAGVEHQEPSPITLKAIDTMKNIIEKNSENIKEIKNTLKEIPTKTEMDLANRKLIDEVLKSVKNDFVLKETFNPVQKIVYGLVGTILAGFMGAILFIVFK